MGSYEGEKRSFIYAFVCMSNFNLIPIVQLCGSGSHTVSYNKAYHYSHLQQSMVPYTLRVSRSCFFVCSGSHNKTSQTGWLKQQKFVFSKFWRLEVKDQGASRISFSCSLSPQLAGATPVCCLLACVWPCVHILPGSSFCFCTDASHIGLEAYSKSFILT